MDSILDKVILYHDSQTLLHTLKINLKIPLLTQTTWGDSNSAPDSTVLKPLKTLGDQLQTRSLYSTVTDYSTKIPTSEDLSNGKGYYLTMVLQVSSPNLWTSPYSDYQSKLFEIIKTKHEDEGLNFQQISNWLNENHFKTPRGKVFKQNHVWSIYTKKKMSIQRFSRENDTEVLSTSVDVVNYVPG